MCSTPILKAHYIGSAWLSKEKNKEQDNTNGDNLPTATSVLSPAVAAGIAALAVSDPSIASAAHY